MVAWCKEPDSSGGSKGKRTQQNQILKTTERKICYCKSKSCTLAVKHHISHMAESSLEFLPAVVHPCYEWYNPFRDNGMTAFSIRYIFQWLPSWRREVSESYSWCLKSSSTVVPVLDILSVPLVVFQSPVLIRLPIIWSHSCRWKCYTIFLKIKMWRKSSHGLAEAFILPVFLMAYFLLSISSVTFLVSLGFRKMSAVSITWVVILRFFWKDNW